MTPNRCLEYPAKRSPLLAGFPEVGDFAERRSVIGKVHLVEEDAVVPLLVVAVELEVDDDAVPSAGNGESRIRPVQVVTHTIKGERLVEHLVVGRALHVDDDVIPGILVRLARDTRLDPLAVRRI